jgi:hypothetical protein
MSGRAGRGCNSRGGGRGHGQGRGLNYTGTNLPAKRGLCTTLCTNIFDYGQKAAADQMRTSWEMLVKYVFTNYGQDISNKLFNKTVVTLVEPLHTPLVLSRHASCKRMVCAGQANIQAARQAQEVMLQAAVVASNPQAPMKLAVLQNEIAQADFEIGVEVPIELTDSEKTQHNNAWQTYREKHANLLKHRLTDPWTVHPNVSRLNEARYRLDKQERFLRSSHLVSTDREDNLVTDGRSIPVCYRL